MTIDELLEINGVFAFIKHTVQLDEVIKSEIERCIRLINRDINLKVVNPVTGQINKT